MNKLNEDYRQRKAAEIEEAKQTINRDLLVYGKWIIQNSYEKDPEAFDDYRIRLQDTFANKFKIEDKTRIAKMVTAILDSLFKEKSNGTGET